MKRIYISNAAVKAVETGGGHPYMAYPTPCTGFKNEYVNVRDVEPLIIALTGMMGHAIMRGYYDQAKEAKQLIKDFESRTYG